MALANIFAKLNDLENKLQQYSPTSGTTPSVSPSELTQLVDRVVALENQTSNKLQDVVTRLAALESRQMPPDVSGKVAMLETKVGQVEAKIVDTKPFLEKLNKIETVTITELKNRITALEQKAAAAPAAVATPAP